MVCAVSIPSTLLNKDITTAVRGSATVNLFGPSHIQCPETEIARVTGTDSWYLLGLEATAAGPT